MICGKFLNFVHNISQLSKMGTIFGETIFCYTESQESQFDTDQLTSRDSLSILLGHSLDQPLLGGFSVFTEWQR